MLDVRAYLDRYLGTGTIACGVVTVVGENGVLCVVNVPGLDQFQIPLIGNFAYHRLKAMPFVEWISITPYGEEENGLKALSDFISTHHLVPDLSDVVPIKVTDEVNPKAYPFGSDVPSIAKRTVDRRGSDESLSKEKIFNLPQKNYYIIYFDIFILC